jgi:hypothetical protein
MPKVVTLSPSQTQISTDKTAIAADGTEVCTVSVTVKNTDQTGGEPNAMSLLRANAVTLAVTPSTGVTITQPTGTANASGSVTGSFVSTNAATVTVSATVLGEAVTSGNPTVVVGGGPPPDPDPGDPFFFDDFAGTQRNPADGFTYATTGSRVSVVSFDGFNCLRFRYGPDASGADSSAEQRFNMGRDLSELWLEYYIHIPSNFALRNDPPANNKFLSLWPVSYSTIGDTYVVTEFERNGTDTSYARMLGYGDLFYSSGTLIRGGNAVQNSNFISAARAGAWHRIRVHYKLASGPGATDGVYEGWIGDSLMWRSRTDWVFWSTGGNNFVRNGYFFGWANSGYTDQTDFHIKGGVDGPKFYDTDPSWSF